MNRKLLILFSCSIFIFNSCNLAIPDITGYIAALFGLIPKKIANTGGSTSTAAISTSTGTGTSSGSTSTQTYSITGTISNLTSSGLILQNNGGSQTSINSGASTFSFINLASGSTYNIIISSLPFGQYCDLTNGTGTITANVTNVSITCYNSGSFDTSFNGTGTVTLSQIAGSPATVSDYSKDLAIDSSNIIFVAGGSTNSSSNDDVITCKINSNGTLDTSFASGAYKPGCATLDTGGTTEYSQSIALMSNGSILNVGCGSGGCPVSIFVNKFTSGGVVDTSFNGVGYYNYTVAAQNEGQSVAVDSSGGVYAIGRSPCPGPSCTWIIIKFTSSGALDTSFNGTGVLNFTSGNYDTATDIKIDTNGKILVSGWSGSPLAMHLRRYNTNGSLDTSFNGTGSYTFPNPGYPNGTFGYSLYLDSSGNIFVAGSGNTAAFPYTDMVVWKLTSSGSLDTSFNGTGYQSHDNAGGNVATPFDEGLSVSVDTYGRIYVAGISCDNTGYSICTGAPYKGFSIVVWKYNANGTPDTTFNSGSHFKIIDNQYGYYQNYYTGKMRMKLDSKNRIVVAAAKDPDAPGSGQYLNLMVWRLWP